MVTMCDCKKGELEALKMKQQRKLGHSAGALDSGLLIRHRDGTTSLSCMYA